MSQNDQNMSDEATTAGNFFFDPTKGPLSPMMYDTSGAQDTGNAAENAGLSDWQKMQPANFSSMNFQGPERAADAVYNPVTENAYNNISTDPSYVQAQKAQLSALQQLQQNGGMNAQDKANLAGIQSQENQNEQGNRQAILQNANMRGTGNSGNSMLAQLVSQQGSANRQNANDLGVAGMAQNRALQAGGQAANLAGGMEQQQYGEQAQQAQAQNAINQFNAGQGLGASEFNANKNQGVNNLASNASNQNQLYNNYQIPATQFGENAQVAQGTTTAGQGVGQYYNAQNQTNKQLMGGILGGATQIGASAMAAWGGKVPGQAPVPGDSFANDTQTVQTSPGEVIVPRSLTHAPASQIGKFVHNPPPVQHPGGTMNPKNKEAMLSALKHLRSKGGM